MNTLERRRINVALAHLADRIDRLEFLLSRLQDAADARGSDCQFPGPPREDPPG